jgi:leucyl aminopeptidase
MANSQNIARDFINAPANNLTPGKLVIRLKKTISTLKLGRRLQYRLLKKNDLQRLAMGALLSVAQGSANQPRFVVLRYRGAKKPLVGLIGKTVTFDSGGISLKTPVGMEKMKGDMAGGAAAIGATLALATLRAKVNLMTIIPAVENMPSGSASRPGDVVWAMNNKSIEIISTDAEGRMTLADALCYAEKQKAKIIIDIATLTGGCVVALGDITAAVMGNNQTLIDKLLTITRQTGEKMWQLPLSTEYEEQIKSTIADMKNSGGRKASSITAGLFLKNFVDKANWLHIDMAGKEISEREKFYTQKGGTGYGVRTIVDFIEEVS